MSWWQIEFSIIGQDNEDSCDVEMWVQAASSRDALLSASARLLLKDGDLIHTAHVSAPRPNPPKHSETRVYPIGFLHDAG